MESRAMDVAEGMNTESQTGDTEIVVGFIDEWLAEHGWRLDDRVLDFALDVRAMLDEAPVEDRQPVSVG